MESSAASLVSVAVYRRAVRSSLERVWENVLDWEHLPWLHRSSFSSIAELDSGPRGWRARVGLRPAAPGHEIDLHLETFPDERRYVARTLEGPGAGTEIWTRLAPVDAERTDIEVEFLLPGVAPAAVDAAGKAMTELYARLWDEDESMMRRRSAELARALTPSPLAAGTLTLGPLDDVRRRLPLRVVWCGAGWRVVEVDGALLAHAATCPHALGPLDDGEIESGLVRCPWHGYRFDLRSGACRDRPGLRLPRAPRVVVDPDSALVRLVAAGAR